MPSPSAAGKCGGEGQSEGDERVMVGGGVGGDVGEGDCGSSSTMWIGGVTIRGIGESIVDSLTQDFRL